MNFKLPDPHPKVLRIGSGNVDVNNPRPKNATRIAANTKAASWGWSEGSNLPRHLEALGGYNALYASKGYFKDEDDANDCPMMVRETHPIEHFSMTKVCNAVQGTTVGHARTFSMVAFQFKPWHELIAHIQVHPNWIKSFAPDSEVVREFIRSMVKFDAMLDFAFMLTPYVIVSGDINISLEDSRKKSYATVHQLCEENRMRGRTIGLDGMYWSKRMSLGKWHDIPQSVTHSDHKFWNVADLVRV